MSQRRSSTHLTRLATVTALAALALGSLASTASAAGAQPAAASPTSVAGAYTFLDQTMDLYASGSTPRLVQSFVGGYLAKHHFTDSVTYDDALMIDAYLAEHGAAALTRAETIANGLLYVQQHDAVGDGRIRAAYAPTPLTSPASVHATDATSDVGNMAWIGQALVHLYDASGAAKYLSAAEAIGEWVQANAYDTRGAGGYTGGQKPNGKRIKWKSTEHNLDLYSLFTLLAQGSGETKWSQHAAWARGFVEAMWDPAESRFYVGSANNGKTINKGERPEDVNSWSYLALEDPAYAGSLDWDVQNLAVNNAGGFSGVSFCAGDRSGVWFEGTAHLADALELRAGAGDEAQAQGYLGDIEYAQANGPNNDGLGVIAASKDKLSDCEGEFYFASLHTGATAWYLLAAARVDPFLASGPSAL